MTTDHTQRLTMANRKLQEQLSEANTGMQQIATAIHYPECWDTACYPTVQDALREIVGGFKCSNDNCTREA